MINEVAYANKIRPERALAARPSRPPLGITSSPVAAAMATLLPLVETEGYDLVDVLLITIPASIVGIIVMSLVMSRHGKDLDDDAEYQRRLAAGEVQPPAPAGRHRRCCRTRSAASRSSSAPSLVICIFGFFEGLRPTVAAEGGGVEPLSVTPIIQMVMLTAAALIVSSAHVKAGDIPDMSIFRSGMVAMIALFGIAWMADTFIANNEDAIVAALGDLADKWPFMIAVVDLPRRGAHDEPVGRDQNDGPARPRARDRRRLHDRHVDRRGRRPLPARQRHADRRGRGGHDRHDHARQARDRPLLPAAAADRWIVTALVGIAIVASSSTPTRAGAAGADDAVAAHLRRRRRVPRHRRDDRRGDLRPARRGCAVAGSAVWLSFLLAGAVTVLLGYNVVKLGDPLPVLGRPDRVPHAGLRQRPPVGIASWLGYFAAFVIVCSMVAVSFGSYAISLFVGDDAWGGWDNVFTSALVVAMAAINMIGAQFVARVASVMVVVLLAVFAVFIAVTIFDLDFDLLAFSGYPPLLGHRRERRAHVLRLPRLRRHHFTVGDLRDPARELPRAMVLALGLTTATYVLIALGVFGTLTVDQAIGYGETAIAEAARPALGDAGFTIMAVAALLATAGATNATLFGSSNLTAMLADVGQFPPVFGRGSRLGRHGGLLITAASSSSSPTSSTSRRSRRSGARLADRLPARRRRRLPPAGRDRRARRRSSSSRWPPRRWCSRSSRSTRCRTRPRRSSRSRDRCCSRSLLDLLWKRLRPSAATPAAMSPGVAGRRPRGRAGPPSAVRSRRGRELQSSCSFVSPGGTHAGYPTADLEERIVALGGHLGLPGVEVSSTPTVVELSLGTLPHQRTLHAPDATPTVDLDAIARLDELVRRLLDAD